MKRDGISGEKPSMQILCKHGADRQYVGVTGTGSTASCLFYGISGSAFVILFSLY